MKYICPVTKSCEAKLKLKGLTLKCGCRVPHERVKSKNHDHREFNCSAVPPYCPACELITGVIMDEWVSKKEADKFEAYYKDISDRCGVVPPDKLY